MPSDVNHINDPRTKEKMKAKLLKENPDMVEEKQRSNLDYDRI